MRILILILSAKNEIYSQLENAIRRTWAKKIPNNVKIFYYYGGEESFSINGDRIFCKSDESIKNIGYKTLDSFRYVYDNFEFDYIFRTNSSSYINIDNLLRFLENKPMDNFYSARVNVEKETKLIFGSGSGYILSRDLIYLVLQNSEKWNHELVDDVAIGKMLFDFGVKLQPSPRLDINNIIDKKLYNYKSEIQYSDLDKNFHFRCKSWNGLSRMDTQIMDYLYFYFNKLDTDL